MSALAIPHSHLSTLLTRLRAHAIFSVLFVWACTSISPAFAGTHAVTAPAQATKQLLEAVGQYSASSSAERPAASQRVRILAQQRNAVLIDTARHDPKSALDALLNETDRAKASALAPEYIETPVSMSGTLEVTVIDYRDGTSEMRHRLTIGTGESMEVHAAGGLDKALVSGTRVRVKGFRLNSHLLLDTTSPDAFQVITAATATSSDFTGVQRTVVVMLNFNNTSVPKHYGPADVVAALSSDVDPYYQEVSYGQTSFTFDAFGWYDVNQSRTCSLDSLRSLAISAADADVDFTQYSRLIVFTPFGPCFNHAGEATIGKTDVGTQDGVVHISTAAIHVMSGLDDGVTSHELGHNFTLHHASRLDCGDLPLFTSTCGSVEYGDLYDVMGSAYNKGHLNAPHKELLGWLPQTNVLEVTTNGRFDIEPIEISTSGLQAIKVPRPGTIPLYVEYRQPIGLDAAWTFATDVYEGALLHFAASGGVRTYLIDPTPPSVNGNSPALHPGQSFTDPFSNTTVSVVAQTASNLTVDVTQGSCSEYSYPAVQITSPALNATITDSVTITADASDESGIQRVDFYQAPVNTLLQNATFIGSDTTAPYSVLWDSTQSGNGLRTLYAVAYDNRPGCASIPNLNRSNVNVANANLVGSTDLTTYRYVGKGGSRQLEVTTSFNAGDEILTQMSLLDVTNGYTFTDLGTVTMQVRGPLESPTPAVITLDAAHCGCNSATYTASWQTSAPGRKNSGTPPGTYTISVSDITVPGWTWDGNMKTKTITLQ